MAKILFMKGKYLNFFIKKQNKFRNVSFTKSIKNIAFQYKLI